MENSVYTKLAAIQSELFVPKGKKNEFGNFNYRSCEDILKVLKPLVNKNGCALFISNKVIVIGTERYVEAEVRLVSIEDGSSIVVTGQAREPYQKKGMDDMQITGATSSYARKYALAGMFCIDNEKDSDLSDNRDYKPTKPEQAKVMKPGVKAWADFKAMPINSNLDDDELKAAFKKLVLEKTGKDKSSQISDAEWLNVIIAIRDAVKENDKDIEEVM